MKTPINATTLRQHWHYSWWKYVLIIAVSLLMWNLIYSMTAPRTPDDEKLDIYIYGFGNEETLQAYMRRIHEEHFPDLKEINAMFITEDEYGPMVLSTRIAAGEGNLYIFPRDTFQSYANQGVFIPLEDMEGVVEMCESAGLKLERGWRKNQETGERHLYGVPVSSFKSLRSIYASGEMYMCLRIMNPNEEDAEKMFRILLEDGIRSLHETAAEEPAPDASSADPENTEKPAA